MNATNLRTALLLAFGLASASAFAGQSYYDYKFVFQGMAYQTNGAGNIVGTPLTDQTILADMAAQGGITDLNSIAIVYHIGGGASFGGDTIDIITTNNASVLTTAFGLYFGDDPSLGRSALTNAPNNEVRRIDYIYTSNNTTYTSFNSHSMGAAVVTRRFTTDGSGNQHATIEGTMSWVVNPQSGRSTIICTGNFTLGAPMF